MKPRGPQNSPWSAGAEKWSRILITVDWLAMVMFAGVAIAILVSHDKSDRVSGIAAVFALLGSGISLVARFRRQRSLSAMLENKPRSTVNLTRWVQVASGGPHEFLCRCGASVHMRGAQWYPNDKDPGGGRFSIVCKCGVGYFKLKS